MIYGDKMFWLIGLTGNLVMSDYYNCFALNVSLQFLTDIFSRIVIFCNQNRLLLQIILERQSRIYCAIL